LAAPLKKDHFPKKRWSQNFLTDANIARKIAQSLDIPSPSLIIEIGPGRGMLTKHLLSKASLLYAVEIDPKLAGELPAHMNHPANLQVIEKDFLDIEISELHANHTQMNLGVIGNLPYHITSPILFKVIENYQQITQAVFMVQKEVGQRIAAKPGNKQFGILSVFCQFYAEVKYLFTVPAHLFYPRPKVDSGVIRLQFRPEAEKHLVNPALFKEIVRQTFGQRRKMLRNTLSNLFPQTILNQINVDLSRRPESLAVEEFVDLTNQLNRFLTLEGNGQIASGYRSQ
jgi:16S rRNA (adenine1518-N6/adenine1519-N6)-dimethyltransferase